MFFVPPARSDGLSFGAGQPSGVRAAIAAAIGFLIVLFCLGPAHALVAVIVVAIVVALLAWLSCGRSAARPATCSAPSSR